MRRRSKIALTISQALLADVERLRKQSGECRSAVFERAIAAYLASERRAEGARRYVEAYRRHPERSADVRQAVATAVAALAAEPWDAEN